MFLFLLTALAASAQPRVALVEETSGRLVLEVTAGGKKAKQAVAAARTAAFEAVLFRGFPASNQLGMALAGTDEAALRKRHAAYFRELLEEGRAQTFVLNESTVRAFAKDVNGQKSTTLRLAVNLTALRADLEARGIIRKFGF